MPEGIPNRLSKVFKGHLAAAALFVSPALEAPAQAQVPAAEAALSTEDEEQVENIEGVIEQVRALNDESSDFIVEDAPGYKELDGYIIAKKNTGADVSGILRKLVQRTEATPTPEYLYVASGVIRDLLLTTTKPTFTTAEKEILMQFMRTLPTNHGNLGRVQKVRLANLYMENIPDMRDEILTTLDTEELLVLKTPLGSHERLWSHPLLEDDDLEAVFEEPTLRHAERVAVLLQPLPNEDRLTFAERATYVSRYLAFRRMEPTEETVQTAVADIERTQSLWGDFEIVQETVLYAASSDDERFLDKEDLIRLTALSKDLQVFTDFNGPKSAASLTRVKEEILESIASTEGTVTVVFNMHGNPDVISLGEVQGKKDGEDVNLSPDELAEAFANRYSNEHNRTRAMTHPDVLIFGTCSSGNYAMKFLEIMRAKSLPVPVLITSGEAGQATYSSTASSKSVEGHVLSMGHPRIKDLYGNQEWNLDSNPIVIVPDRTILPTPTQIADSRAGETVDQI
ncbi:MAG TPA: hypothetical protein VGB97_03195 [Candidatus Paceibacterota bacterium]|jgi:hypothetical protein